MDVQRDHLDEIEVQYLYHVPLFGLEHVLQCSDIISYVS